MYRNAKQYFGEWLNRTLGNRDIPSRDIAAALGVSEPVVSKWRSGKSVPGAGKCQKLAELLNVDLMRLLVTAGHLEEGVECQPFDLPEDKNRRERARAALMKVPGVRELKLNEIEHMLDQTMEFIDERTLDTPDS